MTKRFRIEQADDLYDWCRLREVLVTWFQVGGFEKKQTIKWSHFPENRSSQSIKGPGMTSVVHFRDRV